MRTKAFIIFIFLLFLSNISFALDSLEVIMTFEMPEDSVEFIASNRNSKGSDLNNDGYDDFIHPYYNYINGEKKYQFFFGSSNPDPIPDLELNYIPGAGGLTWGGDLNGDGYKDIVYRVFMNWGDAGDICICFGGDSIDLEPELILHGEDYALDSYNLMFFGKNSGYDFNGDGYADILAGGTGPDFSFNGQVDLFFGGEEIDTIPDFHIQGASGDEFGKYKTSGDLNGDGYDDLILSRNIEPYEEPHKYEIYFGGPNMDTVMDYELLEIWYGPYDVIANGDINGDGYDDLVITGSVDGVNPIIGIYYGNEAGLLTLTSENASPVGCFSYCNINNDSRTDLVATYKYQGIGYLEIFLGKENFSFDPDISLSFNGYDTYYGRIGCNLGDFNGNGKDEIVVNNGEPYNRATVYGLSGGQSIDDPDWSEGITSYEKIIAYSNPFMNTTNISFSLKTSSYIELDIYNIKGQKVRSILNKRVKGGNHVIQWNGRDNDGRRLSSGIYFARLMTDKGFNVKKIIKIGH